MFSRMSQDAFPPDAGERPQIYNRSTWERLYISEHLWSFSKQNKNKQVEAEFPRMYKFSIGWYIHIDRVELIKTGYQFPTVYVPRRNPVTG